MEFDSLSLSVTDLSGAFESLEKQFQEAKMTEATYDSTTDTVFKRDVWWDFSLVLVTILIYLQNRNSDIQVSPATVQQMIDSSSAAIRSEFDQANYEQSEKISQLDRKFSERYDFDWYDAKKFSDTDKLTTSQLIRPSSRKTPTSWKLALSALLLEFKL